MILSHTDTTFPFRRQLLIAVVGLIAFISLLAPSSSWLLRLTAPLKVILIGALAYGFVRVILHLLSMVWMWFATLYALFCYYLGALGVVLTPYIFAVDPQATENGPLLFGSSAYFSAVLPSMAAGVCAAAAGYNWYRSTHAG